MFFFFLLRRVMRRRGRRRDYWQQRKCFLLISLIFSLFFFAGGFVCLGFWLSDQQNNGTLQYWFIVLLAYGVLELLMGIAIFCCMTPPDSPDVVVVNLRQHAPPYDPNVKNPNNYAPPPGYQYTPNQPNQPNQPNYNNNQQPLM